MMEGFLLLLPALSSVILLMLLQGPLLFQIGRAEVECLESDRDALMDFKEGLMDPSNRLVSWTGLSNCCHWRGISCDNITGAVVSLDLHGQNAVNLFQRGSDGLSGEIRPSLARLRSLKHLDLSCNAFDGVRFPEFFHSFKRLEYLNLANAVFYGNIPPSFGNISTLKYLNLTSYGSHLTVRSLEWLSSLVSLRYLVLNGVDLSYVSLDWIKILDTVPHLTNIHLSSCKLNSSISDWSFENLTSLSVLDLSINRFNSAFPYWVSNISSLVSVDFHESGLHGDFPVDFSEMPNLEFLHLSRNDLRYDVADVIDGAWNRLQVLDLARINLYGEIPDGVGNMTSLTYLDLSSNDISGKIPGSISKLCGLIRLDLSNNSLSGSLPIQEEGTTENYCHPFMSPFPRLENLILNDNTLEGVLPSWLGKLPKLVKLILDSNSFEGSIPPSLGNLSRLNDLRLGGNRLSGTLPESLGQLSYLSVLDVSFNRLHGVISEAHFPKTSRMVILRLSSNSFIVNTSSNWNLSSTLWILEMGSCRIGPSFPIWLKSLQRLVQLDLSNASISGEMPSWFWDTTGGVRSLNLSMNELHGHLPLQLNFTSYGEVDFSFNQFEGSIPMDSVNELCLLNLSNNKLSGTIPENIGHLPLGGVTFLSLSANQLTGHIPDSIGSFRLARGIDLSYNNLTGSIPASLGNCLFLQVLDLQNNNLSGVLPDSLGHLSSLFSLHLRNNMITGKIPRTFQNLTSLETLDLGHNRLTGELPLWLGYFLRSLRILSLRSNAFSGQLPSTLARLNSLLVLDLAGNHFNGTVPSSFGNMKVMSQKQSTFRNWRYFMSRNYYEENIMVTLKGMDLQFTRTLSFLTCIDLSANNLHGNFPTQLTNLAGLVVLSLSGNRFQGSIPSNISELTQLASLDLSNNDISDSIPPSMARLSFMGYLNLSDNNLSGRIPFTGQLATFEASAYDGNPSLCGLPLATICSDDDNDDGSGDSGATGQKLGSGEHVDRILYFSIALGFAAGASVPFYVFAIRKSWSDAYSVANCRHWMQHFDRS